MIQKKKSIHYDKYLFVFFIFFFFIKIFIPWIIAGDLIFIPHDFFEIYVPNHNFISNLIHGNKDFINVFLNGTFRWYFIDHIFHPINFLHLILELKYFIYFDYFLKITLLFCSCYKLIFLISRNRKSATIISSFYLGIYVCGYIDYTQLIITYLTYLLLKPKKLKFKNYFFLALLSSHSNVAFLFPPLFFTPILTLLISNRINLYRSIKLISLTILATLLTDIPIFQSLLIDEPLHRSAMVNDIALLTSLKNSFSNLFFDFYYLSAYHIWRLPIAIGIILIIIISIISRNIINQKLLIFLFLMILIKTFLTSNIFFQILINFEILNIFRGINFGRVDKIFPLIICIMLCFLISKEEMYNKIKKKIFLFLFFAAVTVHLSPLSIYLFNSINNNLKTENFLKKNIKDFNFTTSINIIFNEKYQIDDNFEFKNSKYTFDGYFKKTIFKDIYQIVQSNKIMSVGLDPLVPTISNINVIDGYHVLYLNSYKQRFRKIISKEINSSPWLKEYYDNWGNRVYAFYNNSNDLKLNFIAAKEIGASYIVSGFEIKNKHLRLVKFYPDKNNFFHSETWTCYLCKKSRGIYLYSFIE